MSDGDALESRVRDLIRRQDYVQQIVRIALKRFADTRTTSKGSRRLRQVDDSIGPVPSATFTETEVGHQARLVAVVGTPNRAAEQDEAAVTFPRAQDLARVPRERCAVERDEHQTGFGARHQQGRIVEAKPGSVLPPCDVNNGKVPKQARAGRDESMRRSFVSEQPRLCRSLRHALRGFLRGKPWRMPALA